MSNLPAVAVVIPVLNEEEHLPSCISSILQQNYPGRLRIVLAIGPSTDRTLEVATKLSEMDSRIQIVMSPTGRTPDSLNLAISNCQEDVIVRVDAHSELSPKYIELAVKTLQETGADNVGGIMAAEGKTNFERAVSSAMRSKLGVGPAAFHVGGVEGPVESVYLGVFRRSALVRIGGFDPKFTRAQDWELNHRIRTTGGVVWFNPKLKVTYRPRSNLRKLASQYFQYGTWRREVMRSHPETVKRMSALRYLAPPVTVIILITGTAIGIFGVQRDTLAIIGLVPLFTYVVFTLLSTIVLAIKAKRGTHLLPIVLPTMQLTWGLGFLIGKYFKK